VRQILRRFLSAQNEVERPPTCRGQVGAASGRVSGAEATRASLVAVREIIYDNIFGNWIGSERRWPFGEWLTGHHG